METQSESDQSVVPAYSIGVETNIEGLEYDETPVIQAVESTLRTGEIPGADIDVILVDNEFLRELKYEYFGEDRYTDVIAFRLNPEEEAPVEGELYISVEQAAEQALQYEVTADLEILRLTIHGTLHLMGYTDDTPESKEEMTETEDAQLEQFSEPLVVHSLP